MAKQAERDSYFDNAKLLLMILVVLAHGMEITGSTGGVAAAVYRLIYLFHMPAFIFITGYFSARQKRVEVGDLIGQYLLFQVLFSLESHLLKAGTPVGFTLTFTTPVWILWFTLSCIIWKLAAPVAVRLPLPAVMGLLVLAALLAGYDTAIGYYLSLSRTVVFFTFFMLGYFTKDEWLRRLRQIPAYTGLAVFALAFFMLWYLPPLPKQLLYGSVPYGALGYTAWYAGGYRLLVLLCGFVLLAAFFICVPRGRHFFTSFGTRTLPVYYLHGLLLQALRAYLPPLLGGSPWKAALFYLCLPALVFVFSAKPVAVLLYPLLRPWHCIQKGTALICKGKARPKTEE